MKPFKFPVLNELEREALEKIREQISVSSVLFLRTVIMMTIDELAVKTAKSYADSIFDRKIEELRPDDYGE